MINWLLGIIVNKQEIWPYYLGLPVGGWKKAIDCRSLLVWQWPSGSMVVVCRALILGLEVGSDRPDIGPSFRVDPNKFRLSLDFIFRLGSSFFFLT